LVPVREVDLPPRKVDPATAERGGGRRRQAIA
jgi:hypothetical protein